MLGLKELHTLNLANQNSNFEDWSSRRI